MTHRKTIMKFLFVALLMCVFNPGNVFAQAACSIDNIRLGGEDGDAFIGPTSNGDGTYRTCFYVEGSGFPASHDGHILRMNGVDIPIALDTDDNGLEVLCASPLSYDEGLVDVFIELEPGCNATAEDLLDTIAICQALNDSEFCDPPNPVPSLNRTGPAILILLVLGLGLVSVRRLS